MFRILLLLALAPLVAPLFVAPLFVATFVSYSPLSRRAAASLLSPAAASLLLPSAASAQPPAPSSPLRARLRARLLADPSELLLQPATLREPDLFFPPSFAGAWAVTSTLSAVSAPCGVPLFGGNATYERAREELGNPAKSALRYRTRFLRVSDERCVPDREFNLKSIAEASMGAVAVMDLVSSPNRVSASLLPKGAGGQTFNVEILMTGREQEAAGGELLTMELGRNIVSSSGSGGRISLKEIETLTSFEVLEGGDRIRSKQRTMTYLVPAQEPGSVEFRMWRATRGRPVDVRDYDVSYVRVPKAPIAES
jgi:hypothetical protein